MTASCAACVWQTRPLQAAATKTFCRQSLVLLFSIPLYFQLGEAFNLGRAPPQHRTRLGSDAIENHRRRWQRWPPSALGTTAWSLQRSLLPCGQLLRAPGVLQEMIDEADRDGDGEVNEEEFIRIMRKTSLF